MCIRCFIINGALICLLCLTYCVLDFYACGLFFSLNLCLVICVWLFGFGVLIVCFVLNRLFLFGLCYLQFGLC